MKYEKMTDELLIEKLRGGEKEIIDFLMEKYKNLVRKEANAMYLLGGETDDLIQEGMIGLFKAVRDYAPDQNSSFLQFRKIMYYKTVVFSNNGIQKKKTQPVKFLHFSV